MKRKQKKLSKQRKSNLIDAIKRFIWAFAQSKNGLKFCFSNAKDKLSRYLYTIAFCIKSFSQTYIVIYVVVTLYDLIVAFFTKSV